MPYFILDLTIQPVTSVSVGGSGNQGVRADKTIQRDGRNRPIIPASQVKGRLRHMCEAFLRGSGVQVCRPPHPQTTCPQLPEIPDPPCPICRLFGSAWTPGPLRFRNLPQDEVSSALCPSVSLNRRLGVAQEQRLFFLETTAPGTGLVFHCAEAISGVGIEPGAALFLLASLCRIPSWGGAKSRGLGWATVQAVARLDGKELKLDSEGKEVLTQWLTKQQPPTG
jgi:CRISPR/Cas system CSM-associated protein Csm3 (group 7 of RAMP superfamily)